jgi:putative spermidine/putrescine transport system permease protein
MSSAFWHFMRRLFAVLFSIFMLAPIAVVMVASFTGENYVRFPPHSFGIRWYIEAVHNQSFMDGLVLSIEVATSVAIISGIFGVLGAFVLARTTFPGRDAIVAFLMMPIALPHIVLAIALLYMFGAIGVASSPWGLAAGHILLTTPYVLRLTMTSLFGLNRHIEQASQSLGASTFQTLRLVIIPMIAPGVAAGVLFAFLLSFDEVTISLFTSVPGRTTLPAAIFNFAAEGSDPVITAVSGLMIIFVSVLLFIIERFFGVLRLITNEGR